MLFLFFWSGITQARPVLEPQGPTIADTGSAWYRFYVANFDSVDGQRHYKVWLGVPDKKAPDGGFPALFMLDGNAAMAKLNDTLLARLVKASPPVLVAVGYQTTLPFDVNARALDYTPATSIPNDNVYHGHHGGGSEAFRQLLFSTVFPWVNKTAHINPAELSVWGHSFGGLFVLDTLYTAPDRFRHYYAASPSLGWGNDILLRRVDALSAKQFTGRTLLLAEGNGKSDRRDTVAQDDKNARLAEKLREKQLDVRYRIYPGLSHGPMFKASLLDTLNTVAGVTP